MSVVQTVTSIAPASTNSINIMTSHQLSSSSSASSAAHSYLLGTLQPPASSVTPSKARKQAQVQRTRLIALSKHLMTRLQYANFKVENGWTKQSLSEVENLYYRHNEGGPMATSARKSNSTSPNSASAKKPATSGTSSNVSLGSKLFKDVAASKRSDVDDGDVFGGYGLATPPTSGGTVPGSHTAYMANKRGRSPSDAPVSPPTAGPTKRSPNSIKSLQNKASMSSMQTSNGVTSYADFWNRVGTTGPVSPNKKRSADNMDANEISDVTIPTEDTSAAVTAVVSPKKRVRVEEFGEHETGSHERSATLSPAKAALTERGPSFSSSGRK